MELDMDEMNGLVAQGYTLNDVLAHYGIKGMKWGVRRTKNSKGQFEPDDAEEHVRARTLHTVAKKQGTRKLTNRDLEDLNKRLNLEQNYTNLTGKTQQKGAVATGIGWFGSRVGNVGNRMLDEILVANTKQILTVKGVIPTNGKK